MLDILNMKTPREIYETTKIRLTNDNCQSLEVIAIEAIDDAKRE